MCTRVKGRIFLYFENVSDKADFFSFSVAPTFFFPVAVLLLLLEESDAVLDFVGDFDLAPPLNSSSAVCAEAAVVVVVGLHQKTFLGLEETPQTGVFAADVESDATMNKASEDR